LHAGRGRQKRPKPRLLLRLLRLLRLLWLELLRLLLRWLLLRRRLVGGG